MRKTIKRLIMVTVIGAVLTNAISVGAFANNQYMQPDMELVPGTINSKGTNQLNSINFLDGEEEGKIIKDKNNQEIADEKLKTLNAIKHLESKKNSKGPTWGALLRYNTTTTPEMQKRGYLCGPAAALNAIDTRAYHTTGKITSYSQDDLAYMLKTTTSGTPLTSKSWGGVLDYYMPGNKYMITYGSDVANWKATMEADIIYTLDRGYPVIADVKMNRQNGFISYNYEDSYNKNPRDIYHYITIIGYGYLNGQLFFKFLDSADYSYGAFNISSSTLASVTKPMGIIW